MLRPLLILPVILLQLVQGKIKDDSSTLLNHALFKEEPAILEKLRSKHALVDDDDQEEESSKAPVVDEDTWDVSSFDQEEGEFEEEDEDVVGAIKRNNPKKKKSRKHKNVRDKKVLKEPKEDDDNNPVVEKEIVEEHEEYPIPPPSSTNSNVELKEKDEEQIQPTILANTKNDKQIVVYEPTESETEVEEKIKEKETKNVNQEILDRLELLRREIETLKKHSQDAPHDIVPLEATPAVDKSTTSTLDFKEEEFSEFGHRKENRKKWTPKAKATEVQKSHEEQSRTVYYVIGVSLVALLIAIGITYFVLRTYW